MNDVSEEWIEIVSHLAEQAGKEILKLRNEAQSPLFQKEDQSFVTIADLRSNEIIISGLSKNFPTHSILTEETGLSKKNSLEWTWVVDPLDGTKAYMKGIPGFSVMIGLLHYQEPFLGVVYDPLNQRTFSAIRKKGAYEKEKGQKTALSVSSRNDLSKMPLVFSPGFPDKILKDSNFLSPHLPPINSVGIKVGHLVKKEADIYLNHHSVHYWDTCAPQVILEESGGVFTDWKGEKLSYDHPSFKHPPTVTTNGTVHETVLLRLQSNQIK